MQDGNVGAAAPEEAVWHYDEAEDRPRGHPLIATIIGTVLILLSINGQEKPPADAAETIGYLLGRAVGGALLIWVLAYFITIRRAGLGWKIGSFLIFLLASSIAALAVIGQSNIALREDLRGLANMKLLDNGEVALADDPGKRGPVMKLMSDYLADMSAEGKAMDARLDALGFSTLADPVALHRNPKILSDCGKLAQGKAIVAESARNGRARIAALGPQIDALDVPENMRSGLRAGLNQANATSLLGRQEALLTSLVDEQGAICTVLARRRWQPSKGQFLFTSQADLDAFQAHGARVDALVAQIQQFQAGQAAKGRQSQQQLREMLR
jgi:hypothetical protein